MKRFAFTFMLLFAAICLAANATTFSEHNFSIEIPSGWQPVNPPPGGPQVLMIVQSPDKLKTAVVNATKLPASHRAAGASNALVGAKATIGPKGWLIDPEQSLVVNGIPFRFFITHPSTSSSIAVYSAVAGDELYTIDLIFNAGDASTEPELQSIIQGFRLITAADISMAFNSGQRKGYIFGQILISIVLPICAIVCIHRLFFKPKDKTKTIVGILVGIFIMFTGSNISTMGGGAALFQGSMTLLGGWILLILGCVNYAKGKGYSGWFGLFGLLLLPGLVVLVCLRDKHRQLPAAAVHAQEVDKGEK